MIKENKDPSLEDVMLAMRDMMTSALLVESKKLGFSLSHFEVLRHIAESNSLTMKEIAEKLHITPPSASVLIDTLIQKELVKRVNDEVDRRTVHIKLTAKSFKLFSDLHKNKEKVFASMFSKLEPSERKELVRILKKCTN